MAQSHCALLPPVESLHVILAVLPLLFQSIMPGTEEPEIVRRVASPFGGWHYMIDLEIPR